MGDHTESTPGYVLGYADREHRRLGLQAESLRTILPRAKALGIPGASDVEIDTLEQRLRAEAEKTGASFPGSMVCSCHARRL